ncbi:hypothetical protein SPRG_17460 [Saprolegnia parasitica CBS 223.65]|uniref:Uncharacterized protein n=1 Tax=Saprolegnia parasitica (strain CBS 223.65) TaxID=695850 RepID=A0A067BFX2_SAPPC|nr:hypothetical protein SPRG_17460 [Saprolegnia parasitica CBS 223.65]KDO17053.1 hypothetical protein SPRG_17460 [Saprolegnia parasitica CBS 223.65]|eukprot:XP_012212240.1 hypothetical protein SPRG_17460 [Saprolegnia parasitica CBS 223.65]
MRAPCLLVWLSTVAATSQEPWSTTVSSEAGRLLEAAHALRGVDEHNATALYTQVTAMGDAAATSEALYALGDLAFPSDDAHSLFQQSAALGHAQAQHTLALLAAVNAKPSLATSVLYDMFAAAGGDSRAAQTLGYRALYGLGTPVSCATALQYYKQRAATVVTDGATMVAGQWRKPISLADDEKRDPILDQYKLTYVAASAISSKDGKVLFRAAKHLLQRGPIDFRLVRHWLGLALAYGETPAAAYLGHLHAFGWGGPIHHAKALAAYSIAKDVKGGEALLGLGLLYLYGHGVAQNTEVALEHLDKAALQGHAEAMYYVARILTAKKQLSLAARYYEAASKSGHALGMHAYAGIIEKTSIHPFPRTCALAVTLYKRVSEASVHPWLDRAHAAFHRGDYTTSFLLYRLVAEEGYKVALENALWLVEEGYVIASDDVRHRLVKVAAAQGSGLGKLLQADAWLKVGDHKRALAAYTSLVTTPALSYKHRAPAYYSLGYMHEMGLGVQRSRAQALEYYRQSVAVERRVTLPIELWTWKWKLLDLLGWA